jgi:hypothetical protein
MYTGHVVEVPAGRQVATLGRGASAPEFRKAGLHGRRRADQCLQANRAERGALLDLGDFTTPAIYALNSQHRATLSGMLIEHWEEHQVMVGVKIGYIVRGIRNSLERTS